MQLSDNIRLEEEREALEELLREKFKYEPESEIIDFDDLLAQFLSFCSEPHKANNLDLNAAFQAFLESDFYFEYCYELVKNHQDLKTHQYPRRLRKGGSIEYLNPAVQYQIQVLPIVKHRAETPSEDVFLNAWKEFHDESNPDQERIDFYKVIQAGIEHYSNIVYGQCSSTEFQSEIIKLKLAGQYYGLLDTRVSEQIEETFWMLGESELSHEGRNQTMTLLFHIKNAYRNSEKKGFRVNETNSFDNRLPEAKFNHFARCIDIRTLLTQEARYQMSNDAKREQLSPFDTVVWTEKNQLRTDWLLAIHDSLEEGIINAEELAKILEQSGITDEDQEWLLNAIEIISRKEGESAVDYIERVKNCGDPLIIAAKIIDILHNGLSPHKFKIENGRLPREYEQKIEAYAEFLEPYMDSIVRLLPDRLKKIIRSSNPQIMFPPAWQRFCQSISDSVAESIEPIKYRTSRALPLNAA